MFPLTSGHVMGGTGEPPAPIPGSHLYPAHRALKGDGMPGGKANLVGF